MLKSWGFLGVMAMVSASALGAPSFVEMSSDQLSNDDWWLPGPAATTQPLAPRQLEGLRFAQATPSPSDAGSAPANDAAKNNQNRDLEDHGVSSFLSPVAGWLEQSANDYQGIIIKSLSVSRAGVTIAETDAPEKPAVASDATSLTATANNERAFPYWVWDRFAFWLSQSNRDYQDRIVRNLEVSRGGTSPSAQRDDVPVSDPSSLQPEENDPSSQASAEPTTQQLTDDIARMAREAEEAAQTALREANERQKQEAEAERKRLAAVEEAERAAAKARERQLAEAEADRKRREAVREENRLREVRERARLAKLEADRAEARRRAEQEALRKAKAERAAAEARRTAAKRTLSDQQKRFLRQAEAEDARLAAALLAADKARERRLRKGQRFVDFADLSPSKKRRTGNITTKRYPNEGARRSTVVKTARRGERPKVASFVKRKRKGSSQISRCRKKRAGKKLRKLPGWYIVQKGDTLSEIAWRHYRRSGKVGKIRRANRNRIRRSYLIYPCQRLRIPR